MKKKALPKKARHTPKTKATAADKRATRKHRNELKDLYKGATILGKT